MPQRCRDGSRHRVADGSAYLRRSERKYATVPILTMSDLCKLTARRRAGGLMGALVQIEGIRAGAPSRFGSCIGGPGIPRAGRAAAPESTRAAALPSPAQAFTIPLPVK